MDSRVAARYAQALFDVAKKDGTIQSVSDDLNAIRYALKADPKFAQFVNDPSTNRDKKLKLLESVFSDRITALTMHLLRLLLEKRREGLISLVSEQFETLRRTSGNIAYAEIVSADNLSEAEQKAIIKRLETSSGKSIEATFSVDPHLLGGVKAQIGNFVLDGTVRGSLNRLKDRVLYDVLKQS